MKSAIRSTIDSAGRFVIPKSIRQAAGLRPGQPIDIRIENGRIAIEPAPIEVRIEVRNGIAVAVPTGPTPAIGREDIETLKHQLRSECEERGS